MNELEANRTNKESGAYNNRMSFVGDEMVDDDKRENRALFTLVYGTAHDAS
jgi:hypothetical protein